MDLLVVGSIGFDSVETPMGKSEKALGGTAVFCSASASYFARVGMVATVGTDFPEEHIRFLQSKNIDLSGLRVVDGETFHWGARYHDDMNLRDTLFTHLNVFKQFTPDLPENYRHAPYVFLGNIDPTLQLHVLEQVVNPKIVALDTMNFWIEGTPDALQQVLRRVKVLMINDEEARQLSGEKNLVQAARVIRKMGPEILIIKKGEHGALMIYENEYFYAPAFPLETVCDPTGAGDTFAGGFMGYLARAKRVDKRTLRRAMIYGSTMASYVVEGFSVQKLRGLRLEDIYGRFNAFYDLITFDREEV